MKKSKNKYFKKLAGKAKFAVIATTLAVLPFTACFRIGEDEEKLKQAIKEYFMEEEENEMEKRLRENFILEDDSAYGYGRKYDYGNSRDYRRAYDYEHAYRQYRPRKLFHVFPKEVNLSDVPSQYSDYQETNHFMFREVLFNSNPKPFRVLYRNVAFNGAEIGDVKRKQETDIVKDFGTDVIMPNTEISRDDAFFFADSILGRVELKVEYCGHVIDEKTSPFSNYRNVLDFAKQQLITCSHYALVLGEKNSKKESRESFDINWRTK